jgi:Iap family predicted aminopeptidase
MKMTVLKMGTLSLLVGGTAMIPLAYAQTTATIPVQQVTDMLHAVMEADRTVYTQKVVNRLQNEEKIITASEHFTDKKALPLPAQMFRFGAERVAEKNKTFSYSLLSLWPINNQNAPRTPAEKAGLEAVNKDKAKPYYQEETLAGKKYFTAVYADVAISPGCVSCHNEHVDSPRDDFKLNDVMGGVVIRIPL